MRSPAWVQVLCKNLSNRQASIRSRFPGVLLGIADTVRDRVRYRAVLYRSHCEADFLSLPSNALGDAQECLESRPMRNLIVKQFHRAATTIRTELPSRHLHGEYLRSVRDVRCPYRIESIATVFWLTHCHWLVRQRKPIQSAAVVSTRTRTATARTSAMPWWSILMSDRC
jgi:hypothetical protein